MTNLNQVSLQLQAHTLEMSPIPFQASHLARPTKSKTPGLAFVFFPSVDYNSEQRKEGLHSQCFASHFQILSFYP